MLVVSALVGRCVVGVVLPFRFAFVFRHYGAGLVFFALGLREFGRLGNREASLRQTRKS